MRREVKEASRGLNQAIDNLEKVAKRDTTPEEVKKKANSILEGLRKSFKDVERLRMF